MILTRSYVHLIMISVLLLLACCGAYAAVELGSNLVSNPGFDANTTGWSMGSGTSRDAATGHSSVGSARLGASASPTYISANLSSLAGRKLSVSAWTKTNGAGAADGGAVVEIKCLDNASKAIGYRRSRAMATDGAWKQIQMTVRAPLNTASIRITLLNTSASNIAWFDDISCVFPDEVLFRTLIRQPNYRQTIYAGQNGRIVVGAEVFISDSVPASALAVKAELLNGSQKVIASTLPKEVLNKSWQNLGLSVPAGASGELTVRTSLINSANKQVLKQTTHKVNVSSSALPKVYFDTSNRCIVDGAPFFPIGIYGEKTDVADLDRLKNCGINVVLDYSMLARSLEEQADFLNELNNRAMKGIFSLKDCYEPVYDEWSVTSWGNWSGTSNVISGLVNANKDNPGLLAWYINDERSEGYISQIQDMYTQIKTIDPQHPCFQVLWGIQDYAAHVDISDVTGLDCYPVWQRYKDNASSVYMPIFGSQTRVANKVGMYSRPVWMVGEAGKFPVTPTSVAPTAQQMLCEAYQAIINGARGVMFYNLPNVKADGDTQWTALQTAAQNLKAITPIALGEDVAADQKVTSSSTSVECLTRNVGQDVYILAVNTSNSTVNVSFTVPEKLASAKGHAVDSGVPGTATTIILFSGNTLSDSIPSNGTKVYKLRKSSLDILRDSPKPNFKKGHTLPPLSRWGWPLPFEVMKELADNWGYGLDLTTEDANISALNNPASYESRICNLAKSNPVKYPIALITRHYASPSETVAFPESMWCHLNGVNGTKETRVLSNSNGLRLSTGINATDTEVVANTAISLALPASGWIRIDGENLAYSSYSGNKFIISQRGAFNTIAASHAVDAKIFDKPVAIFSPLAPDSIFENLASLWAANITTLRQKYPTIQIPILLEGAEWGLDVLGGNLDYLIQDPDVVAQIPCGPKYGTDAEQAMWFDFISKSKAHQMKIINDALRNAVPDRTYLLHYLASGAGFRDTVTWWSWRSWVYDYKYMRQVTDIPSAEAYYELTVDQWTTGLCGERSNLLTQAMNRVAQQITYGEPMSYNFVCNGWRRENGSDKFIAPDVDHYYGFLKCYYTAGMIGGVAGYFWIPTENDPHWLPQIQALGHVHALFSHLEEYIKNGTLLPGPNMHAYSRDLPAYEFTNASDPTARVLARKMNSSDNWIITAWAAGGADRDVTVTIPILGTVTIQARICGSVYKGSMIEGKAVLQLIDSDGLNPSAGL